MFYLSLDIEASGPFPGLFSLVSVGAVPVVREGGCWCLARERSFYAELQPLEGADELPAATAVHKLTREYLLGNGLAPVLAMQRFDEYYRQQVRRSGKGTGAAWPSSFDLPFVGWYCQKFLARNPLGHSGLDICSFALGLFGCQRRELQARLRQAGLPRPHNPNPHNALADAVEQGELLCQLLNYAQGIHAREPNGSQRPSREET